MFLNITEDEAVYILAAIGRVKGGDELTTSTGFHKGENFGPNLCEKIGENLNIGELHWAEKLYQEMTFTVQGDPSVNFVECYYKSKTYE